MSSHHETEKPQDDTVQDTQGSTGQPDDGQLPGHRGDGPDPDPVSAEEDDGSGSTSGAG
jgi:hypothetical protein